jgi:hypothetical protein
MPTHTTVNASNLVEASFDVSSPSSSQQLALWKPDQALIVMVISNEDQS